MPRAGVVSAASSVAASETTERSIPPRLCLQVPDGNSVASDHEFVVAIELAHDLPAFVSKLALRDFS